MLEDSETDAFLIEQIIKKEYAEIISKRVDTEGEFKDALIKFKPEVILCDHALPQFNSLDALQIYKENNLDIPFILVTGTVSDEFAVQCIKKGVDDYILKHNLIRLPTAIIQALNNREIERNKREAEEALKRQNDKLKSLNEEMDTFIYHLSHNMRTPLKSIMGLLYLYRIEPVQSPKEYFLPMMEENIQRLNSMMDTFFQYSYNYRNDVEFEIIDLDEAIRGVILDLRNNFPEVVPEIKISINKDSVFRTDRFRFSTIIKKILTNSIQYRVKERKLSIGVEGDLSRKELNLRISDNGEGIGMEYIPRVLDMFSRATVTSKGAGLGLFIVREMIEKLGGRIFLKSDASQGTEVSLIFPNRLAKAMH
ncbi:MAG TPA: hybrid sensor histidine kinase/response regulator [Cyclobacteriaceae bacterium]|nr:hybrid sensor histidine kinase/response regulator [Cyclobacteriaceae bacterium]